MERKNAETYVAQLQKKGAKIHDREGAVLYFMQTMPDAVIEIAPAISEPETTPSPVAEPKAAEPKAAEPDAIKSIGLEGWEMLLIRRLTSPLFWGGLAGVWAAWHVLIEIWRRLVLPVLSGIQDWLAGIFKGAFIGGQQVGMIVVFVGAAWAIYRAFAAFGIMKKAGASHIPEDLVFASGSVTQSEQRAVTNAPITLIINSANGNVSLLPPQNEFAR